MNKNIIIVSGSSGSGKGTILKNVFERAKNENIVLIRSCTTRERRFEDEYYHFISRAEFLRLNNNNYFLESNVFANGHFYGTPIKDSLLCALDRISTMPWLSL